MTEIDSERLHRDSIVIDAVCPLQNLTRRLIERGFGAEDVRKILGLNWVRVYRTVWSE